MIKYEVNDLVRTSNSFDVLIHGCNCFCTFGKGVALSIKRAFPEAYEVDQATIKGDKHKLGYVTWTDHTKPMVVNAYTQFKYWSHGQSRTVMVDYEAVRKCMQAINQMWGGQDKKIGMPKIGAGLAGGDWGKISKIIEEELGEEDVTICVLDVGELPR